MKWVPALFVALLAILAPFLGAPAAVSGGLLSAAILAVLVVP